MQKIKTPSDAKGSQALKPVSKGIRDVLYCSVPRRSACNLRQCHALRGIREVNRIGRTPDEQITVHVLRKIERQRYGTANRYYFALDRVGVLLEKGKRWSAQLQEQSAEIEASNEELQNQQEELQQTNEELEEKTRLLEDQNKEVERKSREIGLAKEDLEEKAEQLTLTSKYKSEFLANMSHELRTPLNSLLILSKMLADNLDGNLTPKQVKHADTIHGAGAELLTLINDILDLAKIESGSMTAEVSAIGFVDLKDWAERSFQQLADGKKLALEVQCDESLPAAFHTDVRRLQQVIKNLLSNAFKFTNEGGVTLRMSVAKEGWSANHPVLGREDSVIAFTVADTGIGIPEDKQKIVSRLSSKPMERPAASTAAPGWDCRSAARSPASSVANSD